MVMGVMQLRRCMAFKIARSTTTENLSFYSPSSTSTIDDGFGGGWVFVGGGGTKVDGGKRFGCGR